MTAGTQTGSDEARAGLLVAVVVTFDRLAQLQVTLSRLLESPPALLHAVVVVDNASTDGTAAWLSGLTDSRLVVIRCETNLGGAGGFETGMRDAVRSFDPDWILVMDDDARPAPGTLATFHAAPPPPETAAAAAVYFPDGRICEMNRPSVNPFWSWRVCLRTLRRGRDGYHIPYSAYTETNPTPIDLTSFVGLFLPREAWESGGFPDGGLFLYGDDVIYTLGLRRRGLAIRFDPALRFEHDCSTYRDSRRSGVSPLWKAYYLHRNGLIMYRMAAGVLIWPVLLLVLPKWIAKVRHQAGERRAYLRLIALAVLHGLRGRTDIPHARVVALSALRRRAGAAAARHGIRR